MSRGSAAGARTLARMRAASLRRTTRLGLAGAAYLAYALAFVLLHRAAQLEISALVLIPVVIIAWLLGSWGGLAAGVLSIPVNAGLLYLVGEPRLEFMLDPEVLEGPALVIVVGAVFGLLRDLSLQLQRQLERWRQAASELRESEDRYRVVVEETSEGVALIDADSLRVLEGNPAFQKLSGYGADELRGLTLHDLLPESRDEIERTLSGIRRSRRHLASEKRLRRKDGSVREIEAAVDLIVYGGREVFCCVARDITERKRAPALLARRTEQLQSALDELESFTYSVSHELRAPLLTIHSFATHLLEGYGGRLDGQGRGYLHRILAAADRMNMLINDLLAYGRVGRQRAELEAVDLDEALSEALHHLSSTISKRNARIAAERPFPRVIADRTLLVQILENLLSNAVKFVPADRTPQVRVRAERVAERVRLWVEDNGIGIAPEHRQRIFRVFERLAPADAYPGTGVGLAIVHKGVERMGGRVGVESELGQGSRFWIELAAAPEPEAGAA